MERSGVGAPYLLTAEQERRFVPVVAELEARNGFERESYRHPVIRRADAAVAHAEGQPRRPAPKIAVECVILLFQRAVPRLEAMQQPRRPVFAETKVKAAQDGIVPRVPPQRRIAPQVTMACRPTPRAVWRERQRVVRLAPLPVIQPVARLGIDCEP